MTTTIMVILAVALSLLVINTIYKFIKSRKEKESKREKGEKLRALICQLIIALFGFICIFGYLYNSGMSDQEKKCAMGMVKQFLAEEKKYNAIVVALCGEKDEIGNPEKAKLAAVSGKNDDGSFTIVVETENGSFRDYNVKIIGDTMTVTRRPFK
jgi:hypothetical protein